MTDEDWKKLREDFEKAQELIKEARETGDYSKLTQWLLDADPEYQRLKRELELLDGDV